MAKMSSLDTNQYGAPIPAHHFRQGGRDVYYFTLDLATLDGLLPQRVDEAVIRNANRRLTLSHARRIQEYLESEDRDDWLLGPMLLGIAPKALKFEPYENEHGERYSENFGELRINNRLKNTMRIFDGQHRRRAIQDALTTLRDAKQRADKLASLENASVPIVLYAEEDMEALRQMFADAAKTKRIEGNVVAQFDQRDAFNRAAKHLTKESKLFGRRIEMNRDTVARSSQCLLSINQLAYILRTSEIGYEGRNTRGRNESYMDDINGLYKRCLVWSDEFMPAARKEYADLASGEIENHSIPQERVESFAYSATFIRILAGCYHNWRAENDDWQPLAAFLQEASLEPGSGHGTLVDAGVVAPYGTTLIARRQEVAEAIRYIVQQVKEDNNSTHCQPRKIVSQEEGHDDVKFTPVPAIVSIPGDAQRPTPKPSAVEQPLASRPQLSDWVTLSGKDRGNATTASGPKRQSIRPTAIRLWDGSEQPLNHWYEVLTRIVKKLHTEGRLTVDHTPVLGRQGGLIVATKEDSFKRPERVAGTPFFVEKNFSAESFERNAKLLLKRFGPNHAEASLRYPEDSGG